MLGAARGSVPQQGLVEGGLEVSLSRSALHTVPCAMRLACCAVRTCVLASYSKLANCASSASAAASLQHIYAF